MRPDFMIHNHGSILLLDPLSASAKRWAKDNLPDDAMKWGGATVVEPRYIEPIVEGIKSEGLTVA